MGPFTPRGVLHSSAYAAAVVALVFGAAACQRSITTKSDARPATAKAEGRAAPPAPPVQISVTPANSTAGVSPDRPVVVKVTGGELTTVRLASTGGTVVPGRLSADRTIWTSTGRLAFDTAYAISGQAVDQNKRSQAIAGGFSTLKPRRLTYASVLPISGETVGVGQPIVVYWSRRVPDQAAAERLLTVITDKPVVGSWHWFSGTEVHYRPKVYWPAYTHVTVNINVGAANLGSGVYGEKSRRISFTVGSSVISRVSNATKSMTVFQDGRPLRTFPVSMGRRSMPTSSGTMVVVEKFAQKYFDSASFGIPRNSPGGYYTKVYWDTKFTYGGEYVHSAPWSLGSQGRRNVSHGCVNVSPTNAKWFYYLSKRGDVVQVVGTERAVRPGDGLTDWTVPWAQWAAGSALH